ncbi:TonB-dependent receptor [Pseudopedobacter sp.]|uniref:SusC/RagA family TonB-linked outer membrane protein n=1 Tax=Pseudopedobacter sp. TaxID=1936787 RepID=UPI00333F7C17
MSRLKEQLSLVPFNNRFRLLKLCLLTALALFVSIGETFAQIKVTGVVKESKGEPLPGVAVQVKGGQTGTQTNIDGQFSITVPNSDAVLVFSYIGFLGKEVKVGAQTAVNVMLIENANDLDEVVVIGYGGQVKKRDLTGSISSVSAKTIEERQPINVFDALQGQAAGVLVVNDGGAEPGATGSIQIRGASTLNGGNAPLYVIDGVIDVDGAGAMINPADIQSIEVLKDASSASIYGARAANGVILITTKRGKEGRSDINISYNHLFGKLAHSIPVSNSAEVRLFRDLQNRPNSNVDSLNPAFNADNNLQDLLLGNLGQKKELKVGASGANKSFDYYAGLSYLDDKSIILNSWAKRLQTRVNVGYKLTDKLKYSNNISGSWQKGNSVPIANTVRVVIDRPANTLIYYPDGSLASYIASKRNPVANALHEANLTESFTAQFNNQLEYQFYEDLKFTTLFNGRLDDGQNIYFSPRFLSSGRNQNGGRNELGKRFSWEAQAYFNYNKTIVKDHNITALLGFSTDRRRYDRIHTRYQNSVNEEILVTLPAYIITTDKSVFNNFATANSTVSLFSRLGYNYKGRYLAQGSYRRDGSSRFGKNSRWGNFFSGSVAWRFSDENFMSWSKKFLEDAKLRYSYGQLGNDQIGDYESFTSIAFSGSYNGIGGAGPSETFGNNRIHWEMTTQKNLGLDLSFLKGRLGFTADYYVKTTSDLLYRKELPKETGYSNVTVNIGDIQNKGFEFVLSGMPVATKDFKWTVNANVSFERNKILKLADGIPFVTGTRWYVEEGEKIGNFYGYTSLGVYSWNESNAYNDNWEKLTVVLGNDGNPLYVGGKPVYTYNGQPYTGTVHNMYSSDGNKLQGGDTEWLNVRKDSVINDADQHVLGNPTPDFYLGIVNSLNYKRFALTFMFNGSFGGEVYNSHKERQNNTSNTGAGGPDLVYNSWKKPGDIAKYPAYLEKEKRGNRKASQNSLYIEDASFIRLSSARLSYTLEPNWAKRIYTKGITAYVYGTNLLTWTNYTGYDPEFSSSNVLQPGLDDGRYPRRREIGFGINVNF